MKSIVILTFVLLLVSCGEEAVKTAPAVQENTFAPYDTTAVDSFSVGATSVDVARRIQISSLKYQDSVNKISVKLEEEKLLNKVKEEKEQAEKKLAEEKKKQESEKSKKEKQNITPENPSGTTGNQ